MDISVKQLAHEVGTTSANLISQFQNAGVMVKNDTDLVTEFDKQVLLTYLKSLASSELAAPKRMTLQRKTKSTLHIEPTNSARPISLEVKKSKHYKPHVISNIEPKNEIQHGSEASPVKSPKVFISYSWDDEIHKDWVKKLAATLRQDGVDVILDIWSLRLGDPITHFMEKSIQIADFVLIICTDKYKEKSDNRIGGAGYEDSIISAELFSKSNHRKYIPIVKNSDKTNCIPNSLHSKMYIDLSNSTSYLNSYNNLLLSLFGMQEEAPPIGKPPKFILDAGKI
jgi:SEFIR domain./Bacterial translation initiation factor IF-2 associated region./Translation initiation factor IF-2, N-terminal region.